MSHSNRHQFVKLEKNTKPLSGQRIVRVIAKCGKDGSYSPHLAESLAVSIPPISPDDVSARVTDLMPHLTAYLMDTQDAIISELRKSNGCTEIGDDDISIDKCIAYLEASEKGNRITSEYLASWFKETYSLHAASFIGVMCKWADDMEGWSEEQIAICEKKINVLGSMFAGFAGAKYSPDIPKCRAMIKFGEYLSERDIDSRMSGYIDKAAKMLAIKEAELSSDALGF